MRTGPTSGLTPQMTLTFSRSMMKHTASEDPYPVFHDRVKILKNVVHSNNVISIEVIIALLQGYKHVRDFELI